MFRILWLKFIHSVWGNCVHVLFYAIISMTVFLAASYTDDIIRLNKKQKQIQGQKLALRKQRFGVRGLLAPGRQAGL